jgi:hypothetical protein
MFAGLLELLFQGAQLATAANMFCPWANCSSWLNKESEILCTHDNAVYKVFCYQNIK